MAKYYIAYGSNMSLEQMEYRCPGAKLIGKSIVNNYELLFKGSKTGSYATIEEKKGSKVPVLIWRIEKQDEVNLDYYEGYPKFYYKKNLDVEVNGRSITAMAYIMDERRILGVPTERYYDVLKEAYENFGFDMEILKEGYRKSREGERIYVWNK
jgi:gamma-glutamylcyclotransferase (GGCT)/AIG2-like uncharacterized protein YtfP